MKWLISGIPVLLICTFAMGQRLSSSQNSSTVMPGRSAEKLTPAKPGTSPKNPMGKDENVARRNGFFREYALDKIDSGPAIVAVDEDGSVWTALAKSGKLAHLTN